MKTNTLSIPQELDSPEFIATWEKWMTIRRSMEFRPKNWNVLFPDQPFKNTNWDVLFSRHLEFLKQFGPENASRMLNQSIANRYQGIFLLPGREVDDR